MTTRPVPRVLVAGFEPFAGAALNPSWEIARALDGEVCEAGGLRAPIATVCLPCVFGAAIERLDEALARWRPTLVVALGLAAGRAELTPERVAINVDDARIPDNAGRQPIDLAVVPGAPAAYFSSLPIKAIVRDLRAAGLPAAVSNTAGTFCCNHVFYALMHRLATRPEWSATRGGFVHVPCLPGHDEAGALPSLALERQIEGARILLRTALAVRHDIGETGGRLH